MEKNTITIRVPEGAGQVLRTLHGAGFEAYVVGGCVRDSILMHTPQDWDITTSARPNEVKALFRRTVDTGIRHGTVTVLIGNEGFEVTTYRIDGAYEDGRHPKSVTFTASLDEDLKRRDFTVNAMAYSEETGLIDLFGGLEDLKARVIRAVGDPTERFTEDALRMMRAVRFAAQLDAVIEKKTLQGIRALAPNLRKVSAERTRVELEKLLVSDHPEEMRVLYETGLTAQFLPEFDACMTCEQHNPHHCYTVGEHIIHALCAVRSDKVLRLTMLLHDIGKPQCRTTDENGIDHFHGHVALGAKMADEILKRLKYDNDTRNKVVRLVSFHDRNMEDTEEGVRRGIVAVGEDLFPLLLEVKEADLAAQSTFKAQEKKERILCWRKLYERIIARGDCLSLKSLAVKGKDLTDLGVKPGRGMGQILQKMLDDVLTNPSHNSRDYLLATYVRTPEKP